MEQQIPQIDTEIIGVGNSLLSKNVSFFIGSLLIDNPSTVWYALRIGPRDLLVPPLTLAFRVRGYGAQTYSMGALANDPISGAPIVPSGSPVKVTASTQDQTDDSGTALAVTITGPVTVTIPGVVTVTGSITAVLPPGNAFSADVESVGAVAGAIPNTPLANRTGILLFNISTLGNTYWIGPTNAVALGNGFPLVPGAAILIPVDDATDTWVISPGGADSIAYVEVAA